MFQQSHHSPPSWDYMYSTSIHTAFKIKNRAWHIHPKPTPVWPQTAGRDFAQRSDLFFPRKSRRTFCSNGWGPGQGPFMVVVFLGLIFEQCKGWQIFLHNVLIYIWTKTDSQRCSITKQLGLLVPQNYHKYRVFLWGEGWQGHVVFSFLQASCWLPQKIDCQLLFPSVYFLQNWHIEITWPTMLPNWSWSFSIVCDEFDTSTTCQRSINWHLVSFFHLQLSWYFSKNPTVQPMKCLEASTFL